MFRAKLNETEKVLVEPGSKKKLPCSVDIRIISFGATSIVFGIKKLVLETSTWKFDIALVSKETPVVGVATLF